MREISVNADMMDDNEKAALATGESYIVFPPLRGDVEIWINCDREMSVHIPLHDFKLSAKDLLGDVKTGDFLYHLQRGDTLFTDKKVFEVLRPQNLPMENPIPTLGMVMNSMRPQTSISPYFN